MSSYMRYKHKKNNEHFTRSWVVWAHDIRDKDFSLKAYKRAWVIDSIEKFWQFFNSISEFKRHQVYIMRDKILPKFECPENYRGGSLSYKIQSDRDVWTTFSDVTLLAICNKMININHCDEITGITLNPKGQGAILKIWFRSYEWLRDNTMKIKVRHIGTLTSEILSPHNAAPQCSNNIQTKHMQKIKTKKSSNLGT